jgi:hypothetical protein
MLRPLICHPETLCPFVTSIQAGVTRAAPGLLFRYIVEGDVAKLFWPPALAPTRQDNLWKRTCFEAFLRPPGRADYLEFNFSPSTQWAAYTFTDHRQGMADNHALAPPRMNANASAHDFELTVELDLQIPEGETWDVALTTVIEDVDGRVSHWALQHAPDAADFHHPSTFVYSLR